MGEAILSNDALDGEQLGEVESVRASGIGSLLVVPIARGERPLGVVYLSTSGTKGSFNEGHLELLAAAARVAAPVFEAARHVSELVGRHLMRLHPKDITQEWSVPKRTGKIFMDFNMNVRGKTLNVAYSPRGEPGAPVSMPLTWEELAGAHPLDFRITNAAERLARTGDRWADALTEKQSLEGALKPAKA